MGKKEVKIGKSKGMDRLGSSFGHRDSISNVLCLYFECHLFVKYQVSMHSKMAL